MHVNSINIEPDRHTRKQNIDALAVLVEQRISNGNEATLLTYMFANLRGNSTARMAQMRDAIEQFYGRIVTRVIRRPRSIGASRLPILLAAIDGPAAGSRRLNPDEIRLNDGLHAHGLLLVPAGSRLRMAAYEHVRDQQTLYLRDQRLMRVDARPIRHSPARAAEYAFKSVLRGSVPYDAGVIILPRALSELS